MDQHFFRVHKKVLQMQKARRFVRRKQKNQNCFSPGLNSSSTSLNSMPARYQLVSSGREGRSPCFFLSSMICLQVCNGHLNIDTRLDGDGGDLLHHVTRGVKVHNTFVDTHLKSVPGVGTLTVGRLTGGDPKHLGRQTGGSAHVEALLLGSLDQVLAHLLQSTEVPGAQGDPDTVQLGLLALHAHLLFIFFRHGLQKSFLLVPSWSVYEET